MADWATFAEVSGGAAASLTGLLFVAVSIRIEVIARSEELRNRAAQTLSLFLMVLCVAIFLAIPQETHEAFGAELVVLAVVAGSALFALDRRARKSMAATDAEGRAPTIDVHAPNTATSILLFAAGVLVLFGVHAGRYLLVVPVMTALAGGVWSAWLLMTKAA